METEPVISEQAFKKQIIQSNSVRLSRHKNLFTPDMQQQTEDLMNSLINSNTVEKPIVFKDEESYNLLH